MVQKLAELLRDAEAAHKAYEECHHHATVDEWPTFYAWYMLNHGLAEIVVPTK